MNLTQAQLSAASKALTHFVLLKCSGVNVSVCGCEDKVVRGKWKGHSCPDVPIKKSTHELALMRKHCLQQRAHFRYSPRTDQASSTDEGEVVDGRGWEGCCYGDWGYRKKRGSCLTSVTEKEKARR